MQESETRRFSAVPDPPKPGVDPTYGVFVDTGRQGLIRRFFATSRQLYGLVVGGLAAYLRELPGWKRRRPRFLALRLVVFVGGLPVSRRIKKRPFPVQFRLRLELLGPTYIKLGQVLSLREDLLPKPVTDELKQLLDRLPAVPYPAVVELVADRLGRPVEEVFAHIRSSPLGSASIGQTHVATLIDGRRVVLKFVKPGVRETLRRDTLLLRGLAWLLQWVIPRYQPRRLIAEFRRYTLREADLRREADNAETFASNFRGQPDIVFPEVYREYSNRDLLCMEYLDGVKPGEPKSGLLREIDRERLVDLGAEAIVCMLYRDGFFHADLHPANVLILPGPRVGFVDLGMVGRFDTDLKRTLLYYYYCLVAGDAENAAHYLASMAEPGPDADPRGFMRDVEDVCRQWALHSLFNEHSLGKLILQSVGRGAAHAMYFPVELVLMARAIITFESVGQMLVPDFDAAAVSRKPVLQVTLQRFAPLRLAQESLTALPELIDALAKTPRLVTEGLHLVEQATRRPSENPFAGLRATLFGGSCLVAGAILAGFGGPWPIWAALLIVGVLLPLRRK